jgi:hypothetical protein
MSDVSRCSGMVNDECVTNMCCFSVPAVQLLHLSERDANAQNADEK